MTKKSQGQKTAWQQMALVWKKHVKPPSRPCPGQIKIWEKVLKEKIEEVKNPKVLILGVTPELRDLANKYSLCSIVCDVNLEMIKAMNELIKYKNSKEKITIRNWLEMDFKKESFDLILGDACLNQISSQEKIKKLLRKLKDFLRPNGYLLIREVVRLGQKPPVRGDWQEWFERYKEKKMEKMELVSFFKYQSDGNLYSKSPGKLDWPPVMKKLNFLYKKGKVPKKFYLWVENVFGWKSKYLLVFLKKDLENLFKQYFRILLLEQCQDFSFCKYMPCYLLKKK